MKTFFRVLVATLLTLFCSSCFEHKAVIRINKDGSGTITETTLLSAEASGMIEMMAASGQDPLAKLADKATAEACAKKLGEGVEVEKTGKIEKGERRGAEIVYRFKDINTMKFTLGGSITEVAKATAPAGQPEQARPEQIPATFKYADGLLTVTTPQVKKAEGEAVVEKPEITDQQLALAKGTFKGMQMAFTLQFPDGIAESTADEVEGNTVVMSEIDFGKLTENPDHMKKLMAANEEGPAAVAIAMKGIPGVKGENKQEFTVKLK